MQQEMSLGRERGGRETERREEREREGNSLTHQVSKLIYSVLGPPIFLYKDHKSVANRL